MIMITMPMLPWEMVDPKAIYPFERYRAVSGNHEYRIFYGPKAASEAKPWILVNLVIQEIGGVPRTSSTAPTAPMTTRRKPPSNGKARRYRSDGPTPRRGSGAARTTIRRGLRRSGSRRCRWVFPGQWVSLNQEAGLHQAVLCRRRASADSAATAASNHRAT